MYIPAVSGGQNAPYLQTYQPEQKELPDFSSGYAPYYHDKKPSGIDPVEAVRVMGQLIPGMTEIPPEGKRKLMDTLLRYGQEQRENQIKERNTHVINTYVRPMLEGGGAAAGAVLLGTAGSIAPGPGTVAGGALGAGVGYAAGAQASDILLELFGNPAQHNIPGGRYGKMVNDVAIGAMLEIGAPYAVAGAEKAVSLAKKPLGAAGKAAFGAAGQFLKKLKGKAGVSSAESEAAAPALSAADDLFPAQPHAAPSGGKDPFPLSDYEVNPENIPPYLLNKKSSLGSDAHVYAPEFGYPAGQTAGKADDMLKTLPHIDSNSPDVKYHKLKNDDFVPVSNDKKIRAVMSERPADKFLLGKYTQEWAEENLPHNINIAGTGGPLKGRNVVLSKEGMGRFNQAYITNAQAESIILLDDIIKSGVPFKTEPNINPAKKNIVAVHHLLTRVQLDNNPYLAKTTLWELKNGDLVYHGHEIRQIGKAESSQGLSPASVPQSGTHANNAVLGASLPISSIVDDVANVNPARWFPDDLNKMFNIPATGAGLQNSQIFKAAYDQIKIKNLENPVLDLIASKLPKNTEIMYTPTSDILADLTKLISVEKPNVNDIAHVFHRAIENARATKPPKGGTLNLPPVIGLGMAGAMIGMNADINRDGVIDQRDMLLGLALGINASKDAERLPLPRRTMNHVQNKGTFGLEDLKALMRKKYQSENSKKMPDWMKRRLEAEKLKKTAN